MASIIRQAQRDLAGERVSRIPKENTFRADILRWRKADPEFAERFHAAKFACYAAQGRAVAGGPLGGGRPRRFDESMQGKFIAELETRGGVPGSMRRAAEAVGISLRHVMRKLDPRCHSYDETFADLYWDAIGEMQGEVFEAVLDEALTPRAPSEARRNSLILCQVARSLMPHIFGSR
ncbi:MAG: hypothetical protein AAF604_00660 [Acidobacteriota bacterium]